MPQRVNADPFGELQLLGDLTDRFLHGTGLNGRLSRGRLFVVSPFGGKQKTGMLMRGPVSAEPVQC